jgi:hypothetical protein
MAKTENGLDLDEKGNVITRPVLGWTTGPVAGMDVFLKLDYAENDAQLRTGGKALQCILTPQQALELAETLTKQAKRVLDAPTPTGPAN